MNGPSHPPHPLDDLDPAQRSAATAPGGPHCVLAPAGSGKTRVLVARVLHLIETGTAPERILVLAFNRKAVAELKDRLAAWAPAVTIRTFHSFCLTLLPKAGTRRVVAVRPKLPCAPGEDVVTFSEIIPKAVVRLEGNASLRRQVQQKFPRVLVDEYQDLDASQHELLTHIAPGAALFAVGDDDQCIYHWRGAMVRPLLDFRPEGLHTLSVNYRCAAPVVAFAAKILAPMTERHGKALTSGSPLTGQVESMFADHRHRLEKRVADRLDGMKAHPEDVAVLARKQEWLLALAARVAHRGLSVRRPHERAFLSCQVGRDLRLFARLARLGSEVDPAVGPLVEHPGFPLPVRHRHGIDTFSDLWDKCGRLPEGPWTVPYYRFLRNLATLLGRLNHPDVPVHSALASYESLMLPLLWGRSKHAREIRRWELAGLKRWLPQDLDLGSFWTGDFTLPAGTSGITFSSIHEAKGLEWPVVFCHRFAEGGLDEDHERRLYYVAATRARSRLVLTSLTHPPPEVAELLDPIRKSRWPFPRRG